MSRSRFRVTAFTLFCLVCVSVSAEDLNVLFLGDSGHHQPRARFDQIRPVLSARGIQIVYTDELGDLNAENLSKYDALVLYANIDRIDPDAESALLNYVTAGGGFVPLHCATYCFRNSDKVVALMGAQFQRHGVGVFRTKIENGDHPIMKGFGGFESWDESYVHHLHNEKNRTVLSYRVDAEGREPWTWVRTEGDGRVFYTAWGHDQRTWGNPGFQNLLERGIRWAAKDNVSDVPNYLAEQPFPVPSMTKRRTDVKPFEFIEVGAKIPNYTPGAQWGVQGDALSKMQKPLEPHEAIKHVVVPEGFRVELFASDPDIQGKPIAMAWDERGRLWIAETYDYPNELQPEGKGRDRIRILEDTDGDWKADKFTVFADKLSIPTSIAFYRGGAIVHDGTRTLYLKDTDGDDVADERQVLITGWSQGDTHGGVSNFQYGLDNWIWAMQGYNNSTPVAGGKKQQTFRQGFFRFRPDGSEVEFLRSTNNNTWGLGISEEGLIFGSTANRNPSVFMPIANRYYERVRGWATSLRLGTIADTHLFEPITENVRQVDQHGGYTAGAGHALYTARNFPKEYWNRTAFVAGPTGHLVGTFVLRDKGSDFSSTSPFNLFASDDEWSAPIMAEVGPDGNVWVIDWYNYIVQHNPTPQGFQTGKGNAYETDLRDKKHGRIYRVVHESAKPFTLAVASNEKLVRTLRHPTMLWRKHAQRLLVEKGDASVSPLLMNLVADSSVDEIGLNVGAIHSLWTLHGLGLLDGKDAAVNSTVYAALKHRSAGVRRNALQVLPVTAESTHAVLNSGLLEDADAHVRLAALLALSDLPSVPDAGVALIDAMLRQRANPDRWIGDAIVSAAANNDQQFLAELGRAGEQLDEASLQTIRVVATHFGRGGPVDSVETVIAGLIQADPRVADAVLSGFSDGWPEGQSPKLSDSLDLNLRKLMETLPKSSGGLLVKLARSWGSKRFEDYAKEVSRSLLKQIENDQLPMDARRSATDQLVEFRSGDDEVVESLLDQISPQTDPALGIAIIRSLGKSEAPQAGELILSRFENFTPSNRTAAIAILMSRPKSTKALLAAVEAGDVLLAELSLDQKQALMAHPRNDIKRTARELLSRGGALPNADRQAVLKNMMSVTTRKGDVAKGKEVFKKNCANCHVHGGDGQRVGPDLTGMAVHPKAELLTHILDPSRDVEGNFRVYNVLTVDGVVINGLLASESKTAVEMFDAEGKKKVVLREDIDRLRASPKSLMPEGFEKQIPADAMTDLLEFLTARGKFLPIDMARVATIASDRGMFFSKESMTERMIFPDWNPKTFKGVTFQLTDPKEGKVPNVVMLHGPNTATTQRMPRKVTIPCNGPARAIHLLSGVSGWGYPASGQKSVSMIVRLKYTDGQAEDHELINGEHFADYIRRVDVPQSEFAFALRGQQIRYLAIHPSRADPIKEIELIKGADRSTPIVMAMTIESGGSH